MVRVLGQLLAALEPQGAPAAVSLDPLTAAVQRLQQTPQSEVMDLGTQGLGLSMGHHAAASSASTEGGGIYVRSSAQKTRCVVVKADTIRCGFV